MRFAKIGSGFYGASAALLGGDQKMSDGLLDYIKDIEKDYEVSIVLRAKYRRLPKISVRRDVRHNENEVEAVFPIHRWLDELESHDMVPIVTSELKTLIDKVTRIGEIICEAKDTQ